MQIIFAKIYDIYEFSDKLKEKWDYWHTQQQKKCKNLHFFCNKRCNKRCRL